MENQIDLGLHPIEKKLLLLACKELQNGQRLQVVCDPDPEEYRRDFVWASIGPNFVI